MEVVVFTSTGLFQVVRAESTHELQEKLFEAARELRKAIDF